MNKRLKQLLTILLSISVVFAFSSITAFADPEGGGSGAGVTLEDGTYALPDLKAGPSATFNHFVSTSKRLIVKDDTATLRFITDGSTASIQKYSKIALGKSSELVQTDYQAELPEGTTIIEGKLQQKSKEEDPDQYLFEISMTKAEAEALLANDVDADIYLTVWNKEGSKADKIPGWYKAKDDIYLKLGNAVKKTDLTITNNTGMFKAETASLEEVSNGQKTLIMALSKKGYLYLYKGTYEQAVANGSATENWIAGYENTDGKWEFRIPVEDGETYMPIVAISQSYYEGYMNGQNPIERAFYPRQAEVNADAKTLVTDDYKETTEFTVTSGIADFNVKETAVTSVVGCPNSNVYSVSPTLEMKYSTYDTVTYPTVVSGAVSTATATLTGDKKFAISMMNAPNKAAFKDKTPIEMTFHVAADAPYEEAGTDVVRNVTIDKMAKTIVIEGEPLKNKRLQYDGTEIKFIKEDGTEFGMWSRQEGSTATFSNGKLHISYIPKNTTTYDWMHWGNIKEVLTKDVTMTDEKLELEVSPEDCGYALPVAPIKKKDDTATTTDQYYLAVPALKNFDADYSAVDAAEAAVPADLSIYTDETRQAVETAVSAVVRGKKAEEQADVDAMAEAITNAVSKLVTKEAQAKAAADKAAADKAAADKALSDAKAAANKDIKAAGKLNTSVYTKKDARAVKSALNNLKKVVKDKNTTVKKIQTAQKKLKNAITKAKNNKKIADKVKKAKVQKLTVTPGKKKITVSWKKNKTFKGYQVYYKQAGAKKATTKKVTSTKKVFKKLKTGKKYTVKVRGYKSVNGTVYYGKWTAKKNVTVQ